MHINFLKDNLRYLINERLLLIEKRKAQIKFNCSRQVILSDSQDFSKVKEIDKMLFANQIEIIDTKELIEISKEL